jgi:hypothetical protein
MWVKMRVARKARVTAEKAGVTGKGEGEGLLLSRPAGDSLDGPAGPDMIQPVQNPRAAARPT